MVIIGINVDPAHWNDLDALGGRMRADGFTWVRTVLKSGLEGFLDACEEHGLKVLGVVARESLQGSSFDETADFYANLYGDRISAWEIGNEWDHVSGSSWDLPGGEVTRLGEAFRSVLPQGLLILGGQVSGDPNYLEDVDLSIFDGDALHPYGQRPAEWDDTHWGFGWARDLVTAYIVEIDADNGLPPALPIWITEYGATLTECRTPKRRGVYYLEMLRTLIETPGVCAVFPFKYEDTGVPGFGLLDADGNETPALTMIRDFLREIEIHPEEIKTVGQTLEQFIKTHEATLGKVWVKPKKGATGRYAITDEHYLVEYRDDTGTTWVTPLRQDSGFFV